MWEAKDGRQEKKQLQKEQEAEVDGVAKVAEAGSASDTDPGNSKSTSNAAKRPPEFY